MKKIIIPAFILLLMVACVRPQNYPIIPNISDIAISDSSVTEGVDSVVVSFHFTDGDGDLGVGKNDTSMNIFLVDNRTGYEYKYQMPTASDKKSPQSISGDTWVTVDPLNLTCRPFHPTWDTLSYDVYIVDRAGHKSNKLTTPDIYVKCQ